MNLTTDSKDVVMLRNIAPTHHFVVYDGHREVVKITPDGRVVLAPGVSLDAASLAFWRALDEGVPGMCQRVLDERRKKGEKKP